MNNMLDIMNNMLDIKNNMLDIMNKMLEIMKKMLDFMNKMLDIMNKILWPELQNTHSPAPTGFSPTPTYILFSFYSFYNSFPPFPQKSLSIYGPVSISMEYKVDRCLSVLCSSRKSRNITTGPSDYFTCEAPGFSIIHKFFILKIGHNIMQIGDGDSFGNLHIVDIKHKNCMLTQHNQV